MVCDSGLRLPKTIRVYCSSSTTSTRVRIRHLPAPETEYLYMEEGVDTDKITSGTRYRILFWKLADQILSWHCRQPSEGGTLSYVSHNPVIRLKYQSSIHFQ